MKKELVMRAKSIRVLGIILLIFSGLCVVGMIGFWFAHYYVMQEGYYGFGDSLLICMCVSGIIHFVGYLGLPLLIIASKKEDRERKHNEVATQPKVPVQPIPVLENKYKYCSFCGYKHTKDSNFCMKCGRKFS